jgi:hypothetical protein
MTSDADSTPRRRPPTIDLTAKEVETEQPSQPSAGPEPGGDRSQAGGAGGHAWRNFTGPMQAYAMAAAAGGVAVAAIIVGLWFAGLAPSRSPAPATSAPTPNTAAVDDIAARLDRIQGTLQARQADSGLANRVANAEAEAKALSDTLAALNRRLDDIAVAARSALARADAAVATADASKNAAQGGVQRGDLDTLANRIAALERAVKSLTEDIAHHASSADDRAARMTVAAEALRAVVERGAPYQAEFAAVKALGAEPGALAPLEPFAAEGLPSAVALARELAALTPALQQAAGATAREGSLLARLEQSAQKLVRISPLDAPQGDDPAALIARGNAAAARGDTAAALADLARLPEPARALAASWSKKVEAREAAIAASRRVAADALAALNRPATQ